MPKTFQCNICGSKFGSYASLNQHRSLRSCSRSEHRCRTCGTSFKKKLDLTRHQESHLNIRSCSFCSKNFHRDEILDHIQTTHPPPVAITNENLNNLKFIPSQIKFKRLIQNFNIKLPFLCNENSLKILLLITLKQLFDTLGKTCLRYQVILSGCFSRNSGGLENDVSIIPLRLKSLYYLQNRNIVDQINFLINDTKQRILNLNTIGSGLTFHGFDTIAVEISDIPILTDLPPVKKTL
jgi:hypothetical protein